LNFKRQPGLIKKVRLWLLLAAAAIYVAAVVQNLVVTALADSRLAFGQENLAVAAQYFPASARLQARLAEVALESNSDAETIARAEAAALAAASLLPHDYRVWMVLAQVREAQSDLAGQEAALRRARQAASRNVYIRWQLANLLVRAGRIDESIGEFRAATAAHPELLPTSLDLLWQLAAGDLDKLYELTGGDPESELILADLLLRRGQEGRAITCFTNVGRQARLSSPRGANFIDRLIEQGRLEPARQLWFDTLGEVLQPLYNGGFEAARVPGFGHFDWALGRTSYADIAIDDEQARSGENALRISFSGRHTTRLGGEIRQIVAVKPGVRYRLEFYAKSENVGVAPGPQVVLNTLSTSSWSAASDPVESGSADWQRTALEFVAPAESSALLLTIKRTPWYSYDEPMSGTVWFDDFVLKEQ
jgi:tetratricopeptide (TPR) repeat protein